MPPEPDPLTRIAAYTCVAITAASIVALVWFILS